MDAGMEDVVQKKVLPTLLIVWFNTHAEIMCSKQPRWKLGKAQMLFWEYASNYHNMK